MPTWNEAAPPALPPLRPAQKLVGGLRVGALVTLTALALGVYALGRLLRRHVWRGVRFHLGAARLWARAMLWLMGVTPHVVGARARGAGIVVANHSGWGDILALRATGPMNFVAKAEVRAWLGVGTIAALCETVFIARKRSEAGRQRDALGRRIAHGETLCIFPEGTSSDGRRVLPFKSALLSALFEDGVRDVAWVQPVTLNWRAPKGLPTEFYGWWGTMSFEGHIWQVVCRSFGGAVDLVLHPPRPVADFPDRKALTQFCEAAVRSGRR